MAERNSLRVNRPSVVDETIDGEALIVNLGTGVYYSIAGTGEVIWRMLAEGLSPDAVVAELPMLFDISAESARDVVSAFVAELVEQELLVHCSSEEAPANVARGDEVHRDNVRVRFAPPELKRYADMQELLLLDPVHDVDERGWPEPLQTPSRG